MDLVDGIDIGSSPQVDILGQRSPDNLISSRRHNLFKSSIDDVQFSGAVKQLRSIESLLRKTSSLDDHVNQVLL